MPSMFCAFTAGVKSTGFNRPTSWNGVHGIGLGVRGLNFWSLFLEFEYEFISYLHQC